MNTTTDIKLFFDSLADTWDHNNNAQAVKLRRMLQSCGIPRHARILDIGCGTGVMFPYLLEYEPEAIEAIDLSTRMAEIANEKAKKHSAINVRNMDFYEFRETGCYGIAVIYNAYPHFLDKARFIEKLRAVLMPGGRFVLLHGSGREKINAVHHGQSVSLLSTPLRSCQEESLLFGKYFHIDVQVDSEDCYILSGKLKSASEGKELFKNSASKII